MSVYIVKANYRYPRNQGGDQGNNLGVHPSQKKAQAHFDIVLRHYRERNAEINWDRHNKIEVGSHVELRSAHITTPSNDATVQLVLEKW